jgi:hypothetical protein
LAYDAQRAGDRAAGCAVRRAVRANLATNP